MPPKKNPGPPTRKSERRPQKKDSSNRTPAGESSITVKAPDESVPDIPSSPVPEEPAQAPSSPAPEEPATTPRDPERDTPVAKIEAEEPDHDSATEQPEADHQLALSENLSTSADSEAVTSGKNAAPSKSPDMVSNNNTPAPTAEEFAALAATVAQLRAQLNQSVDNRRDRSVTPAESVFGGSNFTPVGFAAYPAFKPYGKDQNAVNPRYDRQDRKTGVDPGLFGGDKEDFDRWIITLADKFVEDDSTFKTERSRMAVLHAATKGLARDLIASRYQSLEHPFANAAEMVASLQAVYHDRNQGSKARDELRTLQYDPRDKSMDIHQFIGKVNSLADKANIAKSERKTTLYEHIPASLNVELFDASENPDISYEAFVAKVANSALAKQRAYEQRKNAQEKRPHRREESPGHKPRRRRSHDHKKEDRATTTPAQESSRPLEKEKEILKAADLCFLCKKPGHQIKRCPDRKVIAKLLSIVDHAADDDSSAPEDASGVTSSSEHSSSGSEN